MNRSLRSRAVGLQGEQAAVDYLTERGYEIVERNYRAGRGEIDIIARDGSYLCFIEVKTCRSRSFGEPETWVTERKRKRIVSAARMYRANKEIVDQDCRFDVITIRLTREGLLFNHIQDAFWVEEEW